VIADIVNQAGGVEDANAEDALRERSLQRAVARVSGAMSSVQRAREALDAAESQLTAAVAVMKALSKHAKSK
jgi:hypothetical protein